MPGQAAAAAPATGSSSGAPASTASQAHGEKCPKCTTERDDPSSPFCGVCGYNFVTRQGGDMVPPAAKQAGQPATATAGSPPPVVPTQSPSSPRMDLVVTTDTKVAAAPKGRPAQTFSLFEEESLVGRKNSKIAQTVPIEGDDGVSKRHALIIRQQDGRYIIRELGSTNGTKLNGKDLVTGTDYDLKEGDVVTLGEFTVITVKSIRRS
jgi:hypothetical protein